MNNTRKALLPLLIAAALCSAPAVHAKVQGPERPQTHEQVSMALGFVDKLLTVSTLAPHIESRDFAPANAYLEEARRLHKQALISLNENDLVLAIAKRDEAIRLAFEAGHLSQMASASTDKSKNDFEKEELN